MNAIKTHLLTRGFVSAAVLLASALAHETAAADRPASIDVEPKTVEVFVTGSTQQLLTTWQPGDGTVADVTRRARYESSDSDIATVTKTGVIRGHSSGKTMIRVSAEDLSLDIPVFVRPAEELPRVSFASDVVPILTRHACNSGGCHGKSTGQNGFKLSLLGFEPHFDHATLTRESRGRRVAVSNPDASLLLLKATGRVPHGGGKRLDVDSDDYRVLHNWISHGVHGPRENEPRVDQLVVTPADRVLKPGASQQLLVTAHFSDGSTRDVTRRAIYESNVPELADTDETGLVSTESQGGLFSIMIRFGEKITTFRGTIPFSDGSDTPAIADSETPPSSEFDQHLFAQWTHLGVTPSAPADDYEFIRRATIDVCGTLPTAEEIESFVADDQPDKHERLVAQLLERPEYASYFALLWADILQNRGSGYSTSKQRPGTTLFTAWIRDSFAQNKPYDQFVSEILAATGSQQDNPPTIWYRSVRTTPDYVESVAQAFLGVRIQCAQCHHHPAERWSQADYYGLAAVFARVGRKGGFADAEVPTNEVIFLKREGRVVHPRTGEEIAPRALGGPAFDESPFSDPRRELTDWMTAADNPFFARTMVNRMWGHFLGRGIIHPIDDARSTNPPSNPELLDALARDFIDSGFDIKHLIRSITGTRAYRLSSTPNENNANDMQSYSRFYPRRLPAEVLLDGISQVLEVPTTFPGGPGVFPEGTRAIELPDENVPVNFLQVFGRSARTTACECERSVEPALAQALELVNSTVIQRKLSNSPFIERLAAAESEEAGADEIFLRVYGRLPRPEEKQVAVDFVSSASDKNDAYRSLIWALLATNEFLFNH